MRASCFIDEKYIDSTPVSSGQFVITINVPRNLSRGEHELKWSYEFNYDYSLPAINTQDSDYLNYAKFNNSYLALNLNLKASDGTESFTVIGNLDDKEQVFNETFTNEIQMFLLIKTIHVTFQDQKLEKGRHCLVFYVIDSDGIESEPLKVEFNVFIQYPKTLSFSHLLMLHNRITKFW